MKMRRLILAGAAVAMALAGCDEREKVPERWQVRKIMGRDLYSSRDGTVIGNLFCEKVPFPSFGWGERIWINELKWFNTPMPEDYRFKDLPYKVEDFLGSAKIPWNHNRETIRKFAKEHPDCPFMITSLDSWFPWLFKEHYDCDRADYERFVKEFPGFAGFEVLNESDVGFWNFTYATVTNPVCRTHMEKMFPPECEKDPVARMKWFDTAVEKVREMMFGSDRLFSLYSIDPKWAFALAERGIKMLSCENELFQTSAPWRFGMAHTRGAARQFVVPWRWYSAHLIDGYTRDGRRKSGQWAIPSKQWPKDEPKLGVSRSLIRRNNFYGYMCGANMLHLEMDEHFFYVETNGVRRPSDYALDFDEMYRLNASGFDRGATWTPVVALTSVKEQFQRHGFNIKNRDAFAQNAFFWTLTPTLVEDGYKLSDRKSGGEGCLWNSEFGEICDVMCPDTRQPEDEFAAALAPYKVAFMIGWFPRGEVRTGAIADWVRDGGTLVCSADQVTDGHVDADIAGVAFAEKTHEAGKSIVDIETGEEIEPTAGSYLVNEATAKSAKPFWKDEKGQVIAWVNACGRGRVITVACERMMPDDYNRRKHPKGWWEGLQWGISSGRRTFAFMHALLKRAQDETMPVRVEGDVQWGVNRTKAGWLVWLINNKGVRKFQGEWEELDRKFDAKVRITLKSSGKTVEKTVPAGGYDFLAL